MTRRLWTIALLYGVLAGVLIALLRLIEYRWLVLSHSLEIYGGIVAVLFAGLGLWLGRRFMAREREVVREMMVVREVPVPVEVPIEVPLAVPVVPFVSDSARAEALGLTPRELEILSLMAEGLSNRETIVRHQNR
jgi:two-component system, NarL family, response regulator LiaR